MYRLHGKNYKEMLWADDTLKRIEKKITRGDYTDTDYAEFLKVKQLYTRIFAKTKTRQGHAPVNNDTKLKLFYSEDPLNRGVLQRGFHISFCSI